MDGMTSWTEPIPVISDKKGNPGSIVIVDPGFFILTGSNQQRERHVPADKIYSFTFSPLSSSDCLSRRFCFRRLLLSLA
jgi:rRNA maturation protein Rpf1